MYEDSIIIGDFQYYTHKRTLRKRSIADMNDNKPEEEGEILFYGVGDLLYASAILAVCYGLFGVNVYFRYYPDSDKKEVVYHHELLGITSKGYEVCLKDGRNIVFNDEEGEHVLTDSSYRGYVGPDYVTVDPEYALYIFMPYRLYYTGGREYYNDRELGGMMWGWFLGNGDRFYGKYWQAPYPFSIEKIKEHLLHLRSERGIAQRTINRAYILFQILQHHGVSETEDIAQLVLTIFKCFEINYDLDIFERYIGCKKAYDCMREIAKCSKIEFELLMKEARGALYIDSEKLKEAIDDDYYGFKRRGGIGQFSVHKGIIDESQVLSEGYVNEAGELRIKNPIYKGQVYYCLESGDYVIEWPDDEKLNPMFLGDVLEQFNLSWEGIRIVHKGKIVYNGCEDEDEDEGEL